MSASSRPSPSRRDLLRLTGLGIGSAAGLTSLAACRSTSSSDDATGSDTQTVTDMGGTQVEVPTSITQYADGWYAHNEVTIMLTKAEGLVATHCGPDRFPWMYRVCPAMSNATVSFGDDFNFEDVSNLNPQVIFDSSDDLRGKAGEVGIPLVNCLFHTYEEMKQSITLTAQVYGGDAPGIAETYNAELDRVVAAVTEKTDALTDDQRPTVIHGPSVYQLKLDGTGTIIDTWINAAGGKNAVTQETHGADTAFDMEQIITWNPDVIITGTLGEDEKILSARPGPASKRSRTGRSMSIPRGSSAGTATASRSCSRSNGPPTSSTPTCSRTSPSRTRSRTSLHLPRLPAHRRRGRPHPGRQEPRVRAALAWYPAGTGRERAPARRASVGPVPTAPVSSRPSAPGA